MKKEMRIKRRRVARVPVIMQMEAMECGAACLGMILAYYGEWVTLEKLREECGVSRDGQKLSKVVAAAERHGLSYDARRYRPETIYEEATFPCIIHWEGAHFAVLCGVRGNKVYINDPAVGNIVRTKDQFEQGYSGMCVMFSKTGAFKPSGKRPTMGSYIRRRLADSRKAAIFAVVSTVIVSAFGLFQPLFLNKLTGMMPGISDTPVLITISLMYVIALLQLIIGWISAVNQLRLFGATSVNNDTKFMRHIFHLREQFFFQRDVGELLQRQQANSTISETLINTLIPLRLNELLLIVYGILMIRYNPYLSLIGIVAIVISLLVTRRSANRRLNISRVSRSDIGRLYSETTGIIGMFETVKSCGAEESSFSAWARQQNLVQEETFAYDYELSRMRRAITLINDFTICLVFSTGFFLVHSGKIATGAFVAFQSVLMMFLSPVEKIVESGQQLDEMRVDMERVDDVMNYPEYAPYESYHPEKSYSRLSGEIEIKNISFGYTPLEKPFIEDFSLSIKPGSSIALVGKSGSGKSTVAGLIAGLYEPWGGEILYDGKPISGIPEVVFRDSMAVVSQEAILFKDTIENNIKLWNPFIENYEMDFATHKAQIRDVILDKPGGYAFSMSEFGRGLSGGEKQRLEIARAIVNDPTILILDEATSALDVMSEYEITKNLREAGITCIIVAHRLSTIRDCDEIIVMEEGRIVERGRHEELLGKQGYYAKLISNM